MRRKQLYRLPVNSKNILTCQKAFIVLLIYVLVVDLKTRTFNVSNLFKLLVTEHLNWM